MNDLPVLFLRDLSSILLASVFIGTGLLHFLKPRMFEAIVPPSLPWPRALVLISGAAEIRHLLLG